MNGERLISSRILHNGELSVVASGMAEETHARAGIKAIWPEPISAPVQAEMPLVLGFGLYGQTLATGDFLIVAAAVSVAGSDALMPQWMLLVSALIAYPAWMFILRLYDPRPDGKAVESMRRIALAALLATASLCLMVRLSGYSLPALTVGKQAIVMWVALVCWRHLHDTVSRWPALKIPVLVAGAGSRGMAIYDLLKSPHSPLKVEGFLDDNVRTGSRIGSPKVVGTCLDITKAAALTGAKQIIIAMPPNRDPESVRTITEARMRGLVVREMTDLYEEVAGRIPVNFIDGNWLISAHGFSILYDRYLRFTKRLADVVFSALLGLLMLPLFVLVAFLIKRDSPGPVLYRQARVGKDGKVFTIFKFRSMRQDAESNGACWAQECDPRVTRVGGLLRKFRIDELPQIWNILKGEMSFIGPRPERPEFVTVLEKQIPHYSVRHAVKPGVTGWAQVILRYGASVDDALDKLEADLYYIKNMSSLLDFKILMRTVGVVLLAQGSR